MDEDLLQAGLAGQPEEAVKVLQHGVDARVGDQAHQVQGTVAGLLEGALEDGVVVDAARGKSLVDADNLLVDDAPGPDILVPHFRVAHDALRQADIQPAGHQLRPRPLRGQLVGHRCVGQLDRVKRIMLRVVVFTPTIANDQYYWSYLHKILISALILISIPIPFPPGTFGRISGCRIR